MTPGSPLTSKVSVANQDIYSLVVELASDGFWLLDKQFLTVYVNPAMAAMLGYAKDEMIGRSWYDFGDPEWVARAKELEKRRESGVKEPHQFLFLHKSGRAVLTRIATTPLYDLEGNFNGALGIVSDISRQKEAEDALKIKDMLNSIAQSSGIGMCLINPDYTIAWYNDLHTQWFGNLEKTKGRNCFEVFEGRDAVCPGCPSRVSFETATIAVSERTWVTTSIGADRTITLTTSPICDANGTVLQVVEIAQDITDRKLMELALREGRQRLEFALQGGELGMWDWSPQTGVVTFSDLWAQMLEYEVDEVESHIDFFQQHIHPDDKPAVLQRLTAHVEGSLPAYESEHRLRTKSGRWLWVLDRGKVVERGKDGTPLRVSGIIADISERKRAEEEIRNLNAELEQRVIERTAQLEAANKELEAFCYSVSHDLRAPLRHIDGYAGLLVSRCRDGLSDKGLHYVDTIAASARQMGVLIDDLLQFSRTGRAEMRQERVDMNLLLQEALTPLREANSGRTIEWVIEDLPSVRGDCALLRQVWVNLLGNAIKYTRPRETARIEVSAREEHGEIIFLVKDNGVGFDMQYVSKLFGVFRRLHSQQEFEGTGIGLATVQRIISRHGGRVWAEAELNQGARFYFTLQR
ncbi:MAG: PAS domain S-box protein [Myxococcales bacterium]